METLHQIAQRGDVEELNQLLAQNPFILHQIPLINNFQNPLHYACVFGHFNFAKKILELRPELARQLDPEGYSPMHLASAYGHLEISREMIRVDPSIFRVKGREGLTPLHLAVIGGWVDLIDNMVGNCEGCLEDLTLEKESVFHVAVKSFRFESLKVLMNWVKELGKEEVLNGRDECGNTVLHLAVWKKQRQVVEMLLTNTPSTLEVNAINKGGLTALDLLSIFPSEAGDREIHDILQRSGAFKARDLNNNSSPTSQANNFRQTDSSKDLIEYFKYHQGRDSPSDVRTTLLIIAILVATATYQVGISPPGGTWQDDNGHVAGTSILGTHDSVVHIFLVSCNSIGFNVSVYMIATLTAKFPLQTEFQICLMALYVTFNIAMSNTSPKSTQVFTIAFTSALPTAVPLLCKMLRKYKVFERLKGSFLKFWTRC